MLHICMQKVTNQSGENSQNIYLPAAQGAEISEEGPYTADYMGSIKYINAISQIIFFFFKENL